MPNATIVGGGVSGLTTAVSLLEAGWDARIIAKDTWESCVSRVAAAVWTTTDQEPQESVRRWAIASRRRFAEICQDPGSGVVPLRQRELECVDPGPRWWESTPYTRRIRPDELPAGYAAGWEIDGFMVEPPLYLTWLTSRMESLRGSITIAEVERLEDVDGDAIVNCTGLGAATLVGDDTMYPIRGQVVAVANSGIRDAVADESDIDRVAYVYPRSREVILGGTRQSGNTDPAPDPATTERILTDCARLDDRVTEPDVIEVRVGFRPGRPTVRVEAERLPDGRPVVHNYGHAGAGYILSWGCAQDVVGLAGAWRR